MRRRQFSFVAVVHEVAHARASLRQHLVDVPVRRLHGVEHPLDVFPRHVLVKEVAHGVDEDEARATPALRLLHARRAKGEVEPLLVGMSDDAPEPLREPLGIAVVAPGAELGAARHRVPGALRPLDCGFPCHGQATRSDFGIATPMPQRMPHVVVFHCGGDASPQFKPFKVLVRAR